MIRLAANQTVARMNVMISKSVMLVANLLLPRVYVPSLQGWDSVAMETDVNLRSIRSLTC